MLIKSKGFQNSILLVVTLMLLSALAVLLVDAVKLIENSKYSAAIIVGLISLFGVAITSSINFYLQVRDHRKQRKFQISKERRATLVDLNTRLSTAHAEYGKLCVQALSKIQLVEDENNDLTDDRRDELWDEAWKDVDRAQLQRDKWATEIYSLHSVITIYFPDEKVQDKWSEYTDTLAVKPKKELTSESLQEDLDLANKQSAMLSNFIDLVLNVFANKLLIND